MPDLIPATINLSEQRKCIEQADGFPSLFCDYFWGNVFKRDEIPVIRKKTQVLLTREGHFQRCRERVTIIGRFFSVKGAFEIAPTESHQLISHNLVVVLMPAEAIIPPSIPTSVAHHPRISFFMPFYPLHGYPGQR